MLWGSGGERFLSVHLARTLGGKCSSLLTSGRMGRGEERGSGMVDYNGGIFGQGE